MNIKNTISFFKTHWAFVGFALVHLLFITEDFEHQPSLLLISLALLIPGYFVFYSKSSENTKGILTPVFIAFSVFPISTFCIYFHLGFSKVFASAVLGTILGLIPNPKSSVKLKHFQLAGFAATFSGMSFLRDSLVWEENLLLLFSTLAIIGSFIYIKLTPFFNGLGGKLGTIGFTSIIGSLFVYFVSEWIF